MIDVRWAWLFLDTPRAEAETSWRFWTDVTGSTLSPRRGGLGEFATLVPHEGDAWLKVQAVHEAGPGGGVHLDLDVEDLAGSATRAVRLGATETGRFDDPGDPDVVVLSSPGGFPFCLTRWDGATTQVRTGAFLLDQLCLDIPDRHWPAEVAFWESLTGWTAGPSSAAEFRPLARPHGIPVRVLCQRLGSQGDAVTGHVDAACADRRASTAEHVAAGARIESVGEGWTVMRDPVDRVYCLTDRSPVSGASS